MPAITHVLPEMKAAKEGKFGRKLGSMVTKETVFQRVTRREYELAVITTTAWKELTELKWSKIDHLVALLD